MDLWIILAMVFMTNQLTQSASWSEWNSWSACDTACGGGTRKRFRYCQGQMQSCSGANMETKRCNLAPCQAGWTRWSIFSSCKLTCVRTRYQRCYAGRQGNCPQNARNRNYAVESQDESCTGHHCANRENIWNKAAQAYVPGWDPDKNQWRTNYISPIDPDTGDYYEGFIKETNSYSEGWNTEKNDWFEGYDRDNKKWKAGYVRPIDENGRFSPGYDIKNNRWYRGYSIPRQRFIDGYNVQRKRFPGNFKPASPITNPTKCDVSDGWNPVFADYYPGYDAVNKRWNNGYYSPINPKTDQPYFGFNMTTNKWHPDWDMEKKRMKSADTTSKHYNPQAGAYYPGYANDLGDRDLYDRPFRFPVKNPSATNVKDKHYEGFLPSVNKWNEGWDLENMRWKEGWNPKYGEQGDWMQGYNPETRTWEDGFADPAKAPNGLKGWLPEKNRWKLGWDPVNGKYYDGFDPNTQTWDENWDVANRRWKYGFKSPYILFAIIAAILLLLCIPCVVYFLRKRFCQEGSGSGDGSQDSGSRKQTMTGVGSGAIGLGAGRGKPAGGAKKKKRASEGEAEWEFHMEEKDSDEEIDDFHDEMGNVNVPEIFRRK